MESTMPPFFRYFFAGVAVGLLVVTSTALSGCSSRAPCGNDTAAISNLRILVTMQEMFRDGDKDGDSVENYAGGLSQLFRHGQLIDGVLSTVPAGHDGGEDSNEES